MRLKKGYILLLMLLGSITVNAQSNIPLTLLSNLHLGWNTSKQNDYKWHNFYVGTSYGKALSTLPKAYWTVGLDLNNSKYTLYPNRAYAQGGSNSHLSTTSITLPTAIGYQVFNQFGLRGNVQTGPILEWIVKQELDNRAYEKLTPLQVGWNVGLNIRIFILNIGVGYSYYPTALFNDGRLNRSAINFSIGL